MLHWFSLPCQIVYLTVWHGTPKPKHRWHICEKKEKGNKFFYYTIKHVKIQIQKFFKIAFDCNLESNANSCPKALGIGKSSKDIEGGNVSKILDAANDCSELTNCKIYILYSNSSNVPRQNRVAHKNLNHQAWMPSKYCDLLFTLFYQINVPVRIIEFWEKTLTKVLWLFLISENYFAWLTWFLAFCTK